MLIGHDWLRAFVPHSLTPTEVRDLLSRHVATVDAMRVLREDLRGIVVARVLEAMRHPNADTLWLTRVDDGTGAPLSVVCGAPNVSVGALYPFARPGTVLPGGVKIEKRKIRGEVSNGMLCSARELVLGEDHAGIMQLDVEVAPGTPFLDAVPVGDTQYEVDVLPNRPDLLSHLGVAREVAALTGLTLGFPDGLGHVDGIPEPVTAEREASGGGATVRLEDADGCPHYMAVVIRGVRVAPSPRWLAARLESVGLRPINNVVDATNYLLHGFGQPMHAFDLARLARSTVVIRRARDGERLTTLDGVERSLSPHMTVIADADRAVAVAGVMGGRDSEVTDATTDILLEVAYFTPRQVRLTRRALGLSTDASYRFERGIDPAVTPLALLLAAELITRVAGGTVAGAPVRVGRPIPTPAPVALRPERLGRLLGDRVPVDEIRQRLQAIGFTVAGTEGALTITPPSWRSDVARDVDLVEEIARLRGYDVLSDEVKPFRPTAVPDDPFYVTSRRVRDLLVGLGLSETRPLPFVRGADETHVRVRNPLAEDEPHLRRSVLETLARRAEHNLARMEGNVRLFEIGPAFAPRGDELPVEEMRVGALIMGARRPPHFTEPEPPVFDAWDVKALGERIVQGAYPGEPTALEPSEANGTEWSVVVGAGADRRVVGRAGPVALDRPRWAAAAWGVEVSLGVMPNGFVAPPGQHAHAPQGARLGAGAAVRYRPLPTTPATSVDLALVLPERLAARDVEQVLRASGGDLLERLAILDEYRGEHVSPGFRSVTWRLTFRDPARTLRDKEIEGRRQKILRTLESELGVRSRTA